MSNDRDDTSLFRAIFGEPPRRSGETTEPDSPRPAPPRAQAAPPPDDFGDDPPGHLVDRTSPTGPGQPFVGRCRYCGGEGLGPVAALEPCPKAPGNSSLTDTETYDSAMIRPAPFIMMGAMTGRITYIHAERVVPDHLDQVMELLRRIARTSEMSASIMRDTARTGGWEGAERVAAQFDRLHETADRARDMLAPAMRDSVQAARGMPYRAVPCNCGHGSCHDWHVAGVAQVHGVSFTRWQAEFVARMLNATVRPTASPGSALDTLIQIADPIGESLPDNQRVTEFIRAVHDLRNNPISTLAQALQTALVEIERLRRPNALQAVQEAVMEALAIHIAGSDPKPVAPPSSYDRDAMAAIVERVAKEGLPRPRDLDVALDALLGCVAPEPQLMEAGH